MCLKNPSNLLISLSCTALPLSMNYYTEVAVECPKKQILRKCDKFEQGRQRTCNITFSNYQLNSQFLYSSTIYMLHYDPQHVSSSTLLILRRTNCITTASGIVTLCKQSYSMQVESRLQSALHLQNPANRTHNPQLHTRPTT